MRIDQKTAPLGDCPAERFIPHKLFENLFFFFLLELKVINNLFCNFSNFFPHASPLDCTQASA